MKRTYRADHWKDVPGVKYPEPPADTLPEGMLTTAQAAELLGLPEKSRYTGLARRGIRSAYYRVGRRTLRAWHKADVLAKMQENADMPEDCPADAITTQHAAAIMGWSYDKNTATKLRKLGVRSTLYRFDGRVCNAWNRQDLQNAANAPKKARRAKMAQVMPKTANPPCQPPAKVGKTEF